MNDNDCAHLRNDRGFSKNTIGKLKFRSATIENVKPAIEELRKTFEETALIESGILVRNEASVSINTQLTSKKIIIPYLDVDRETVYRLRPHKYGFKDKGIDVYCRYLLKDKLDQVVLTEGEFKAVALWQLGIPAIAIPGVASYSKEHFDELVEVLHEYTVKSVTILFDNEDKADPNAPNFKPDFRDRYDTDFWAYIMASQLYGAGLEAKIARLPDEWRINGKADCDSALAAGHTKAEFEAIINNAVPSFKYVDGLSQEAQSVVRRNIDKHFFSSSLEIGWKPVERNCYVWRTTKVDKEGNMRTKREIISNFYLEIDYTLQTSQDCLRRGIFVNRFGEQSEPFFLQPTDMSSTQKFTEFALAKGNYLWQGNTEQLKEVWRYTFAHDDGAVVYQPDGYGLNEHGVWQFGNVLINQSSKIIYPDDEDIFWTESNRIGFVRPLDSATISDSRKRSKNESIGVPVVVTDNVLDIRKMMYLLRDATDRSGGFGAWLGVGWDVATLFCDRIVDAYHIFPELFIAGKTGSGKTTFGRWLMCLVGNSQREGKSVSTTTDKALYRMLSKYSNLPIWLGDFRNTTPESRIGTFRNIYDRISYERAEFSNDLRTRSTPIRGTLLLDGEETPRDPALQSRCVVLLLSEHQRGTQETYYNVEAMSSSFSNLAFQVLSKGNVIAPKILDNIPGFLTEIAKVTADQRLALNYAIVVSSLIAMLETFEIELGEDNYKFLCWLADEALRNRELKVSEDVIMQFFSKLNILTSRRTVQEDIHFIVEEDTLWLWFAGVFDEYEVDEARRKHQVFKPSVLLDYLRDEPWVMETSVRKPMGGKRQRCLRIDLTEAPEIVRTFTEQIEEGQVET